MKSRSRSLFHCGSSPTQRCFAFSRRRSLRIKKTLLAPAVIIFASRTVNVLLRRFFTLQVVTIPFSSSPASCTDYVFCFNVSMFACLEITPVGGQLSARFVVKKEFCFGCVLIVSLRWQDKKSIQFVVSLWVFHLYILTRVSQDFTASVVSRLMILYVIGASFSLIECASCHRISNPMASLRRSSFSCADLTPERLSRQIRTLPRRINLFSNLFD